jgi:hypothetical protein
MDHQSQPVTLWARVAAIAARQHGVISRRGLLRLGASPTQIHDRVRSGLLHPIHHGVYAVGHTNLTVEGRFMAAVLAGGPTAVLSHHAAAYLHRLLGTPPSLPHVTATPKGLSRPGITIHSGSLTRADKTRRSEIPVTTVNRTILDMAGELEAFWLERLLAEAYFRGHRNQRAVLGLIERHPHRAGITALREILEAGHHTLGRTESPLEDRFALFLAQRRLERPELNPTITVAGKKIRPDCLWRRPRMVAECDGRDAHTRRGTWENDKVRDRRLLVAGLAPVRVTSEQLDDVAKADALEADLRALGVADRLAA